MDVQLSDAEKVFIIHGAEKSLRSDGRSPLDYRPITLEIGVMPSANGSARVHIASTDLIVGVKADLIQVDDMKTYRNRINFSVHSACCAASLFTGDDDFVTLVASALHGAYNNDYVLPDLKRLLVSRVHVWKLHVDVLLLQCDGNVIDAAAIGVKAALRDTEICEVQTRPGDEGKVIVDLPDDSTVWKMDVSRVPLIVSVNRLGSAKIVDISLAEEACTHSALWVAVAPPADVQNNVEINEDDCLITFIQECHGGSLEVDSLEEMMSIGVKVAAQMHSALNAKLNEASETLEDPTLTFMLD